MKKFNRVLITGCGGMLGNAIYPYFVERCGTVLATDKDASEAWLSELDVRDASAVTAVLDDFAPDLILHLAAETDLEFCETEQDVAIAVNATATRHIAEQARARGATLVYISTAGVFDGKKETCYTEADAAIPIMMYGQSKFDGEQYVREVNSRYYVVRAGWMVGGGPKKDHKFVSKMLDQIAEGRTVLHVVNDRWGTPTYTHDFANNLFSLLDTEQYGTYHMVCEGTGTRHDVAKEIVAACVRHDIRVEAVDSEYFAEEYFAPRPRSEMLVNENLNRLGINQMRPWQVALRDYIVAEYGHLVAQYAAPHSNVEAFPDAERRQQADRREQVVSWTLAERRQRARRANTAAALAARTASVARAG